MRQRLSSQIVAMAAPCCSSDEASARDAIQKEAVRASMPYVNQRWLGGMLQFQDHRGSIKRLGELQDLALRCAGQARKRKPRSCGAR